MPEATATGMGNTRDMVRALSQLSPAQHTMLQTVSRLDSEVTVNEVAHTLGIHPNSARETLDALVGLKLLIRRQKPRAGRGRPAWVYEAVVPESVTQFHEHVADLMVATAQTLLNTHDDYVDIANVLGKQWALQYMKRAHIPDHSHFPQLNAESDISLYVSKIRLFLTAQGFHAKPCEDPTQFTLHTLPYTSHEEGVHEIICTMHAAMINQIVSRLSANQLQADIVPGAEETQAIVTISYKDGKAGACRLGSLP
ncbi:MAG: hypothetical protein Q4P66_06310 [Actinomycetaceae bacterium]|nr:hypothetical protein [Actinomycetaceae bacterium]